MEASDEVCFLSDDYNSYMEDTQDWQKEEHLGNYCL